MKSSKPSDLIYESEEELAQYSEEYPDKDSLKTWIKDGVACYIVHNEIIPMKDREAYREMLKWISFDFYNGYCRFKKMPLSGGRFQDYIPVHGGITFGSRASDGSYVYGFDTNHYSDSINPDIKSTGWLTAQCETLACGLWVASEYEGQYLKAKSQEEKAIVIDNYRTYMREEFDSDGDLGFGGMINFLGGDL